jgi:hypothetical protein
MVAIVQQTCDAAAGAWLNAVKHAEAKRDALQAKVHEATAEIARIKQALLGTSIGSTSSANAGGFNDNEVSMLPSDYHPYLQLCLHQLLLSTLFHIHGPVTQPSS